MTYRRRLSSENTDCNLQIFFRFCLLCVGGKASKSSANLFISRYETIYEWVEPSLQKLRKALLNCSYFHFRSAVYIGWWFKKYLNLNVLAHTNRPHQCKSMYVFLGHEAVLFIEGTHYSKKRTTNIPHPCNCLTSTLYGKLNIKRLNVCLLWARSSPLDNHQKCMKEEVLLIKTNRNGCFWFNNCVRLMGLPGYTFVLLSELHLVNGSLYFTPLLQNRWTVKKLWKVQLQLTSLTYPVILLFSDE